MLRSDRGIDDLSMGFRAKGAMVQEAMVCSLDLAIGSESMRMVVDEVLSGVDGIAFSSALTVDTFMETAHAMSPRSVIMAALAASTVGAMGPLIRTRLEREGVRVDAMPLEAVMPSLIDATMEASKGRNTPWAMVPS